MPVYVPRTKTARAKLSGLSPRPLRAVCLTCGHLTDDPPALSRPDRWWCCNRWRRAR